MLSAMPEPADLGMLLRTVEVFIAERLGAVGAPPRVEDRAASGGSPSIRAAGRNVFASSRSGMPYGRYLRSSDCAPSASAEKAQDGEQNDSADKRCNQRPYDAASEMYSKDASQPPSDERADNPYDDVNDDAETPSVDNPPSQCASDAAND
jgi:hypothetical protein